MCHHTCTPAIYLIALRVVQDSGHHAVLLPNADRLLCVQPSNLRLASPEQAAALLAQCTAARTRDPTDVRPLSTLYLSTYMHTSSAYSRVSVCAGRQERLTCAALLRMLHGSLPDTQLAQVCTVCDSVRKCVDFSYCLAEPCATHILYTQVPEAGSAGTDEDMLNQHVSLLASLAPVVRETIHPDGTRQASYILIALKLIPYSYPSP